MKRGPHLGSISNIKIELSEEFCVRENTHLRVVVGLDKRIQEVVGSLRLVQANDRGAALDSVRVFPL